jgi:hypothetical protein
MVFGLDLLVRRISQALNTRRTGQTRPDCMSTVKGKNVMHARHALCTDCLNGYTDCLNGCTDCLNGCTDCLNGHTDCLNGCNTDGLTSFDGHSPLLACFDVSNSIASSALHIFTPPRPYFLSAYPLCSPPQITTRSRKHSSPITVLKNTRSTSLLGHFPF